MRSLRNKSILIVGGAGFIGSHLVDHIINKKPSNLVVVDNFFLGKKENLRSAKKTFPRLEVYKTDATKYGAVEKIIKKEKIDVVFNLATKALGYSFVDPDDAYMVNVNIVSVLLRLLHKKQYDTLIHFSSSEAYGTAKFVPISENHPLDPTTLYAAGKASADLMVNSYYHTYKLDVAIVRPFNTYGPRQNKGSYAGVIPITIDRILSGRKPVLAGDGKQTRDFIYVKEVADAAIKVFSNEVSKGKTLNIASGKEITVREIIDRLIEILGYKGKVSRNSSRLADVRRHLADVSSSNKLINFKSTLPLSEGLELTIKWYKENMSRSGK